MSTEIAAIAQMALHASGGYFVFHIPGRDPAAPSDTQVMLPKAHWLAAVQTDTAPDRIYRIYIGCVN